MSNFIKINDVSLESNIKVIKKREYIHYLQADQLVTDAANEAQELERLSCAAYEEEKARGYQDGLSGAEDEINKKMIELSQSAIENIKDIESSLVGVVSYCVSKILGDVDSQHLVAKLVSKKMLELEKAKEFIIRIHPSVNSSYVQEFVESKFDLDVFCLKKDPQLNPDQIVVETPIGSISTSIEKEVSALIGEVQSIFL